MLNDWERIIVSPEEIKMKKRMRQCKENAPGCKGSFVPGRFWQKTCENQECKKQRHARQSKLWKKIHKYRVRIYMKNYRTI